MRFLGENGTFTTIAKKASETTDFLPVHLQFEKVTFSHPDKVALIDGAGKAMSYAQLLEQVYHLSALLLDKGVKKGDVVAFRSSHNSNLIVGILGILGAGGVMLPISLEMPNEMVSAQLEDCKVRFILTENGAVSPETKGFVQIQMNVPFTPVNGSFKLLSGKHAYIIYTSGSSGKPKGVRVSHMGIANLCHWYREFCHIGPSSRTLIMIPFTSDAMYKNIFGTLCSGGTLVMSDKAGYHPLRILKRIQDEQITHINCVPRAIYQVLYLASRNEYKGLNSLKALILGGETINPAHLADWFQKKESSCSLYNMYGPTECTDISIATQLKHSQLTAGTSIPIGKPIQGMKAYIVNDDGVLHPNGRKGELWISGVGVTHGYINNHILTAHNFIPDPFSEKETVYKTGDLCSRDENGNIYFHGRIDRQIKIKGFRVELEEIEFRLKEVQGVLQAVVLPTKANGEIDKLKAFVVMEDELKMDVVRLQIHLMKYLPKYMIPNIIVQIDSIPIASNGKTDFKQLAMN
ncbi:amino acid adenylation domain-containing protein [Aureisphaera galaxeae]|uniref:amino acid adenylation domain-containing protein n=1 Tax=Aureisphaera galaxeae TaxID=1538023 RepID=UPI002351028B|nr:amino acid adenylation domain-containing protein [Aureisphaera galaxeae]MDC8004293.1 amino acid adenylation domain-containing protein [Aureisphaera galaxeae]